MYIHTHTFNLNPSCCIDLMLNPCVGIVWDISSSLKRFKHDVLPIYIWNLIINNKHCYVVYIYVVYTYQHYLTQVTIYVTLFEFYVIFVTLIIDPCWLLIDDICQ